MTKNWFKISKILIIGALALVLAIPPYSSKAQSEALKSALNEVVQSEETIKGNSVEAKKAIFLKIINLSLLETKELKEKIDNLGELEEYFGLKDWFSAKLDEYIKYFQLLREQIKSGLNEDELGNLINDFKNWRESDYNLQIKKIIDFILVFQQKQSLVTAENRFEKISKDLQKIKSLKGNKLELANRLLKEARIYLDEAWRLYSLSEKLLLPFDEEIAATSTVATTSTTSTEVLQLQISDVRELLKNTMNEIKNAYQKFFQISVLIKKSR